MKTTTTQQHLYLKLAIFLTFGIIVLLGMYSWRKQEEYKNLQESMLQLETSLEQERKKNLLRLDSLEQAVLVQENINLQLKNSLVLIVAKRTLLKKQSHENKAHIKRIADPDSLRHEITRHYRR